MHRAFLFSLASLAAATVLGAPPEIQPSSAPVSPEMQSNQAATAPPGGPAASTSASCKQGTMTGDWGGWRTGLKDAGITVTPVYEAEVFGEVSGDHTGAISDGLINLTLDLDLERLTKVWSGAAFHLNVLEIYGPGLSSKYTGDFSGTSNLAGYNTLRLQELWLQQAFWNQRFSFRVGLLAADSEYFLSQASCTFINATFGAFNLFGLNFIDAPAYPTAAPAVRLDFAPASFLDFKLGVFAPDEIPTEDKHGADLNFQHGRNGALFALEAAYLVNQSPNDRGLAGTYKVGTIINRGDYASLHSQAENALDADRRLHRGTNWAVYGVIDQELFKDGAHVVEGFLRGGFASPTYSFITNYIDAGFNFTGYVPGRASDVVAIGVARSGVGRQFSEREELEGEPASTQETVIELTYKAPLTPWWTIQPDLQYIINPGGVIHTNNALVLGIRSTLTF